MWQRGFKHHRGSRHHRTKRLQRSDKQIPPCRWIALPGLNFTNIPKKLDRFKSKITMMTIAKSCKLYVQSRSILWMVSATWTQANPEKFCQPRYKKFFDQMFFDLYMYFAIASAMKGHNFTHFEERDQKLIEHHTHYVSVCGCPGKQSIENF